MHAIEHWMILAAIALSLGVFFRQLLRKTSIPYTPVLLIAGLGLGLGVRLDFWSGVIPPVFIEAVRQADLANLDPAALLLIFLPPLLFESGFAMDSHIFRRSLFQVVVLAVPVLLLSTFLGGALMKCILPGEWSWTSALMFGALISATDPVAVVALLRELGVSKRLSTVIEGESLLNDGTSIAVFLLFYGLLTGAAGDASPLAYGLKSFTLIAGGGIIAGALVACLLLVLLRRIPTDALTEITLTVISSYAAFLLAEHFHVSGVLAVVALGVILSAGGKTAISAGVMDFLKHFWELCAYAANTLVFVLVGIVVAFTPAPADWLLWCGAMTLLYLGLQLVRGGAILLHLPLLRRSGYGMSLKDTAILTWGGLRGAVALAMALVVAANPQLPQGVRDGVLQFTAGVVVLTLLINGTTMSWLLGKLGYFVDHPLKERFRHRAAHLLREGSEAELRVLQADGYALAADWPKVKGWAPDLPPASAASRDSTQDDSSLIEEKSHILENEKRHLWELYSGGVLSGNAYVRILERVDLILDDLQHGGQHPPAWQPWRVPLWLRTILSLPFGKGIGRRLLLRRIALSYDMAKGAILIHQRQCDNLNSLTFSEEDRDQVRRWLQHLLSRAETTLNKIREIHPEAVRTVETIAARRRLLGWQCGRIEELQEQGLLDEADAAEWRLQVETIHHQAEYLDILPPPPARRLLAESPFLAALPEAARQRILAAVEERDFIPEAQIFGENTERPPLIFVTRGAIEMGGQTFGPGAFLGCMQLLTQGTFPGQAKALTAVACASIPAQLIHTLIEEEPEIHWLLLREVTIGIVEPILTQHPSWRGLPSDSLRRQIVHSMVIFCADGEAIDHPAIILTHPRSGRFTPHLLEAGTQPERGAMLYRCPSTA